MQVCSPTPLVSLFDNSRNPAISARCLQVHRAPSSPSHSAGPWSTVSYDFADTLSEDALEESIAQHDVVQSVELRLIDDIPIDKEEYGEVDLFSRPDLLLFEAEAFDFRKVWRDLPLISIHTKM